MQIRECRIKAFGQIQNCELKNLDASLVVVSGSNESGKSTLFEFFKTMIYGIYPTLPEHHPYLPWTGGRLEGSLSFRLQDGVEGTVLRRLCRFPEGFILNGRRIKIRNQTLPAAKMISRELFGSVYALTLSEMASIQNKAWQEIEERLLGEFTLDVFRPIRKVVGELEEEASSLWRENRRGKPKAKELEQRIRALRQQVRSAALRDSEMRKLQEELTQIEGRLDKERVRRVQLKSSLACLERLLPCRKLVDKIEEYRLQSGDRTELEDLPEKPVERLAELHNAVEEYREKMLRKRVQLNDLQKGILNFTEDDRKLLQLAPEIRNWTSRSVTYEQLGERLAEVRGELADLKQRASPLSLRVLSTELDDRLAEALLVLPEDEVADAAGKVAENRASLEEVGHGSTARPSSSLLPSVFLAIVGVGLCLIRTNDFILATGLALFAFGSAWALSVWLKNRQEEKLRTRLRSDLERELRQNSERIGQLLSEVPVPKERLGEADRFLVSDLLSLRAFANEIRNREATLSTLEIRRNELRLELTRWIQSQGLKVHPPDFKSVEILHEALEMATRREIEFNHTRVTGAEVNEEIGLLTRQLRTCESEISRLESRFRDLADGDLEKGLKVLATRRNTLQTLEHLQRKLEEDFPDWESLLSTESARGETEKLTAEVESCKSELEALSETIQELAGERVSRLKDIQYLQSQPTVADLESEIVQLQADLADITFRRDQLLLLAKTIRYGDQRFRDRHQPDVLRRAGEYLSLITNNRYVRLDLDESSQGLEVVPAGEIRPVPVAQPLSQGIRDQIYLSLRLALVEHLDEGCERLPLFLDEILINWDESRRRQGYSVFRKILSSRQVFIFTCHDWLAEELLGELGGVTVQISGS